MRMPTLWGVVKINSDDIKVLIGTYINQDLEQDLTKFLKDRKSTFVLKHEDMKGISQDIITQIKY